MTKKDRKAEEAKAAQRVLTVKIYLDDPCFKEDFVGEVKSILDDVKYLIEDIKDGDSQPLLASSGEACGQVELQYE